MPYPKAEQPSTQRVERSPHAVLRRQRSDRARPIQRSRSVALVIPEPATRIFSDDPFFPSLVQAVTQQLQDTSHQLVLMMANSVESRDHVERYAKAGHLDGVMMVSMHGPDPLPVALQRIGVPVVAMERPLGPATAPVVGVDSVAGAEAATRHLLDRGRRRLATICGPQDMPAGIDRLGGFRRALLGTGCQSAIAGGDFTRESGECAMRDLLDQDPDLDAVFVASDLMAQGALRALRSAGRRVPEDVAVVGFDDLAAARYAEPPLTTVHQPVAELGRMLARQVVRLIGGEAVEDEIILGTQLVVRESS
jgi:DNA-binding LacI/PurR family transcriptional regulator